MNVILVCKVFFFLFFVFVFNSLNADIVETLNKPGPCGGAREWARLAVDPLSWLLSHKRLGEVHFVKLLHISPNRLSLSNQDKGSSLAHSLPHPHVPHGPGLHNLTNAREMKPMIWYKGIICYRSKILSKVARMYSHSCKDFWENLWIFIHLTLIYLTPFWGFSVLEIWIWCRKLK